MLRTWLAILAALAAGLSAPMPGLAQDRFTTPIGGDGGQQYVIRCTKGQMLTGLDARIDAYVNAIAPICDGNVMARAGNGGSVASSARCPDGSVVSKILVTVLRSANRLVKDFTLQCVARTNRATVTAQVALNTPGVRNQPLIMTSAYIQTQVDCGSQEIVGIQGRVGAALDAFGLICGAPPPAGKPITGIGKRPVAAGNGQTCVTGFVWRNAWDGDTTCVTPGIRAQAAQDNAAAAARSVTGQVGGNCVNGYVWRDAMPGDRVCVSPATRAQAAADNAAARTRVQ